MHNRLQQSVTIAFALLALHLIAPPVAAALNSDTGNALTVYWYESIGEHTTLDTIDWSDPDRVSNADQVNWAATLAPWEPGAADDLYAVRIETAIRAHADGLYRFRLTSDDGSRLFVDAQLVIDNDGTHSMTQVEGSVTLTGEYVPIEIYYFDRYGSAGLILEWRPPGASSFSVVPQEAFANVSAPILVDWFYESHAISNFDDVDWSTPDRSTAEAELNWPNRDDSGFLEGAPDDRFALRARSRLVVPESGVYRFELGSDDGSRLRIGGQTIIETDAQQTFQYHDADVYLTEGLHDLEVLYFEDSDWAGLVLMWQGPSDPSASVIPEGSFRTPVGTARPRIVGWSEQPRLESEREDWP